MQQLWVSLSVKGCKNNWNNSGTGPRISADGWGNELEEKLSSNQRWPHPQGTNKNAGKLCGWIKRSRAHCAFEQLFTMNRGGQEKGVRAPGGVVSVWSSWSAGVGWIRALVTDFTYKASEFSLSLSIHLFVHTNTDHLPSPFPLHRNSKRVYFEKST